MFTDPRCRCVVLVVTIFLSALAPLATAAELNFSGRFESDDDLFVQALAIQSDAHVTLWTTSFASGGFAPVLSVFEGSGDMMLLGLDHAGWGQCEICPADPTTSFVWDAFLDLELKAGAYLVTIAQDDNVPLGSNYLDGFSRTGQGNFTGVDFGPGQGAFFLIDGTPRTPDWAFRISSDGGIAAVPEPASAILVLCGAALFLGRLAIRTSCKRKDLCLCIAGVFALGLSSNVSAADAVLTGDAYVSSKNATINTGALPTLNIGSGNYALIQFDLASVPAGTTASGIANARLTVYVSRVGQPGALDMKAVLAQWTESSVTLNLAPALGAAEGTVPVTLPGYRSIDVTSLVKSWITTPATNFGVALAPAASAPATEVFLDSKENASTSHPPVLEINLVSGAASGWSDNGAVITSVSGRSLAVGSTVVSPTAGVIVPVTIASFGPVSVTGGFYFNDSPGALAFNLPGITPALVGSKYCFRNAPGRTGAITLRAPAMTYIDKDGVNGLVSGVLSSTGALGDSACMVAVSATQYVAFIGSGTWTNN